MFNKHWSDVAMPSQVKLTTARKTIFFFPYVLKRWSFQKNRTGFWSFFYYREIWYLFFPEMWSYPWAENEKWFFSKKYMDIWYFLQIFLKDGLFKKEHDLSCITLHEKQHFCKNAQRKYHISLIFRNWQKYHISRKMKIKENIIFSIISDIFRNKSIEQDLDDK